MRTFKFSLRLIYVSTLISLSALRTLAQQDTLIMPDQRTGQVLGLPAPFCGHVIDLLMRNQMRQNDGIRGADFGEGFFAPVLSVAMKPGDLELQSVQLMSEGHPAQGPVYLVTVQNHSQIPVGNFRITLVGVLGTIQINSPNVTGVVRRMEPGAIAQFPMQLPVSVMTMGRRDQQLCGFDTLVVAVDSFDELLEADELNNVQILLRSEVAPLVPIAPATPQTALLNGAVPPQTTPIAAPAPSLLPGDQAAPTPSPLDGVDLDTLQIGEDPKSESP